MISASWPMPKSYVPPVQEKPEKNSSSRIKNTIDSFQKKGILKDTLSESEKKLLQDCLTEAMKELAAKVLLKSINETIINKSKTHDLDDVYDPQGQIPFPQSSLFDNSSL